MPKLLNHISFTYSYLCLTQPLDAMPILAQVTNHRTEFCLRFHFVQKVINNKCNNITNNIIYETIM